MTTQPSQPTEAPPVLTREALMNGALRAYIASQHPDTPILSIEALHDSIDRTLADRPAVPPGAGGPDAVWVFGYGSLIWNPAFHHAESRLGRVHGWHRRFCLWTHMGRGTPENPGLMLGLDAGGSCTGLAYRVAPDTLREELFVIWQREMVTSSYRPIWVRVRTGDLVIPAITFAIDRRTERYAGLVPEERVVETCATAEGALGNCAEYLFNTVDHLAEMGVVDRHLSHIRRRVEARRDTLGR
ncbi:MAG: gamma-glutamylcyclotransferase [Azospirillaceae bacterium]